MHVVIRNFPGMTDVDRAGQLARDGLAPILKAQPGFRGYWIVRFEGGGGSVSVFDTAEAAEAGHARALDWIHENLGPMTGGAAPEVLKGEVLVEIGAGAVA